MSSNTDCQQQFSDEVNRFEAVALFSVILTLVCAMVRIVKKSWMASHPSAAAKGLFAMSALKILLSLLLFTVINPKCPQGCDCGNYSQSFFYPTIVLVIGLYWSLLGYKYHKIAKEQTENENGAAGTGAEGAESAEMVSDNEVV